MGAMTTGRFASVAPVRRCVDVATRGITLWMSFGCLLYASSTWLKFLDELTTEGLDLTKENWFEWSSAIYWRCFTEPAWVFFSDFNIQPLQESLLGKTLLWTSDLLVQNDAWKKQPCSYSFSLNLPRFSRTLFRNTGVHLESQDLIASKKRWVDDWRVHSSVLQRQKGNQGKSNI
jgi:hypothetical protein